MHNNVVVNFRETSWKCQSWVRASFHYEEKRLWANQWSGSRSEISTGLSTDSEYSLILIYRVFVLVVAFQYQIVFGRHVWVGLKYFAFHVALLQQNCYVALELKKKNRQKNHLAVFHLGDDMETCGFELSHHMGKLYCIFQNARKLFRV